MHVLNIFNPDLNLLSLTINCWLVCRCLYPNPSPTNDAQDVNIKISYRHPDNEINMY